MKSIKKAFLLSLVLIAMVSSLFVCVAAGNKLVVAAKQYGNSEVAGAQNDFKPAKQYANQDYVLVGAGETYETLDAALAGVEDGAKIMLKAGEYTLGVVINKNVEIYGPNANVAATAERAAEAAITVTANVYENVNAANVVFNGVQLIGSAGTNNGGIYFQNTAKSGKLAFVSCKIEKMNTFVKYITDGAKTNVVIDKCHISYVGQFIVWTTKSMESVKVVNSYVDGSTCGSIVNAAAALFRVRIGVLEAYNNVFNGDSGNEPGYFESIAAASFVKYNTFNNVTKFAHPTAANQLTFDENLYLDAEGTALAASPVAANGVTADATVAASAEDLQAKYEAYACKEIEYVLDGGVLPEGAANKYVVGEGLVLPTPTKENALFLGWSKEQGSSEYVTEIGADATEKVTVYANWMDLSVEVISKIEYELNGGQFVSPYPYASHEEMVADFVVDFNKHSGKTVAANGSDFFARSYMGDGSSAGYKFLTSAEYGAKWNWMLQLINADRVAREKAELSSSDGQAEARGEIHTLLNLCGPQSGYGTDRTGLTFADYAAKYLPADESVPAVKYEHKTGEETVLPLAEKAGYGFAGWYVEDGATIATSANSGFWSNYTNNVFLFTKANYTAAKFSHRVELVAQENGTYKVSKVAVSGADYTMAGDLVIMISDSHANVADYDDFKAQLVEGEYVVVEGDIATGVATVKEVKVYDKLPALHEGDVKLNALYYALEYNISYEVNGGKLSAGAPTSNASQNALVLDMTAEKAGYEFVGWALTAGGEVVTEIAAGRTEALVLYAVYEAITYKIEYETNGGAFSKDEIAFIYDSYAALVADFLADYAAKYGVANLNVDNFYSKSADYGFRAFWNDAELSAKWSWLKEFVLNYDENYLGVAYMKHESSGSYYNLYWRANIAALLQQGRIYSTLSMDFNGIDNEAWWNTYVPTKIVSVAANPKYEYTINDLPLVLETPMRKDEVAFLGWCLNEKLRDEFTTLPAGTLGDIKLYAKWADSQEIYEEFDIIYELNEGRFESEYVDSYVETVGLASLPVPSKVGYTFLGWTLTQESTEYVLSIGTEVTGDVTLYAQWKEKESSMPKLMYVGEGQEYATLEAAMAVAGNGDTIVLSAGTYTGATITKSVIIKGPNLNVNPNTQERAAEAWFTSDIVVAASNVTINGIALTGPARIKAATDRNIDALTISYVNVFNTTANAGNNSGTAPFDLATGSYTISNVVIEYSRISFDSTAEGYTSPSRPMVLHTTNIHNLTVDNNVFVAVRLNYNDAVKLGNGASVGATGEIVFTNNHFENFAQYLIWFQKYGDVNVLIDNNTWLNNGQTAGSHGVVRFASYTGTENAVNCEMYYNTVDNSYLLLRVDAAPEAATFLCKYNIVVNSADTLFVKNATKASVVCDSNYWGVESVSDANFTGATHTNDLTDAAEIPSKDEAWLEGKLIVGEGQAYATIAEALAAATDGAEIYLTAGTYAEELTIDKAVTIYGPNHGVAGTAERKEEAVLAKPIVIAAAGVTIDGVKLDTTANVKVQANNTTLTNIYSVATTFLKNGTTNRNAVIVTDGAVSDFELSYSYFNTGSSTYLKGVFANDTAVTNALFLNNYFKNEGTDNSSLSDCIAMYNSKGVIEFIGNTFDWVTDDWCIMLGSTGCNADVINVIDNSFIAPEGYYTCGLMLRNAPATCKINVIHNFFGKLAGTILSFRYSKAGAEINVKYNVYDQTAYRQDKYAAGNANLGAATVNYEGNYYGLPLPSGYIHATDYGVVTDPATCDELYEAWKIAQDLGPSEIYSNISYELNGGAFTGAYDVKYLEGEKVALVGATLEGYKFMGWSLDAEGTKTYTSIQPDWKGDITLYAQWKPIYGVEYELNGGSTTETLPETVVEGTKVTLPTLEKAGFIFLGWTLEAESEDYIKDVTVTADVKVYAQWLEATYFYVTYELNGGSVMYSSRAELVQDFVNDYSTLLNKGYATADDISTASFGDIDYHTFLDSSSLLANGQTPREKWLWLAEHLYELSVRDLKSNNCNVLGLKAVINQTAYSGDMIYGLSYAFRAFLKGTVIRPGTSYVSVDHSVYENANAFWGALSAGEPKVYGYYEETTLPAANLENYKFVGWFTNPEFTGDPITVVNHEIVGEGLTLYAKFVEAVPVTSVTIDNKFAEIKRFETFQLEWTINPENANIKQVKFESSNPKVATVDDKGFITAVANGTVTITITSQSVSGCTDSFTFEVYSPDHFEIAYETESYVEIDGSIKLLAEYIKRDGTVEGVVWSSETPEIATVDATTGVVTGLNAGVATIRATLASDETIYQDFVVTVLEAEMSEALQFAVEQHESNVFVRYGLSIGGAYLSDIFGSVSKIFYNHELEINDEYKAAGNATNDYYTNSTKEQGLEFITVHYTAGFDATADTDNHASYFTSGSADVSIHYVTGNKGSNNGVATSEIYATLDHEHGAWHAGDSNARYYSNSDKKNASGELIFSWMPTGVKADETPLLDLVWTASDDFYFEINGQKTTIKLPKTYDYKSRGTTHIYNADGTISSTAQFNAGYSWAKIENRPVEEYFNSQDFPVKIVDGEYYMGPTWWSYGQTVAGLICGSGGNLNSIGIESCVNQGSDLWYTWQVTAQLVASLMVQYDLGIERVKGHHFFDGKHCPAPMLENNMEIWYEFIELVEAEYALLTTYKDAKYSIEVAEDSKDVLSENGRMVESEFAQIVTYTVTVEVNGVTETITLASALNGCYSK